MNRPLVAMKALNRAGMLLALLLLLSMTACDPEPSEEGPAATDTTAADVPDAPITTLPALSDAAEREALVDQRVELANMRVDDVTGDSTFWIVPANGSADERVFVVLENLEEWQSGTGTGADGRYNVDPGDVLTVYGRIVALQPDDPTVWDIQNEDAQGPLEGRVYVRADRLDFTERAPEP
ncbi:MAG: hypothetical protein ACR2GR_02935 [Rhodothermales bacterium]